MAETEREKALDAALGQIEKQFGKGSVMRMGDNLNMHIESIPTGALSLDLALGIDSICMLRLSPMRMTEPLPNCFSICPSAASSAFSRSVSAIPLSSVRALLCPCSALFVLLRLCALLRDLGQARSSLLVPAGDPTAGL